MPPFTQSNQKEDEDHKPKEVVGSKDLREVFKEKDRVRGSFSLNGVMLQNFEANNPASVVSAINAQRGATGVSAEIDDEGHLVLVNSSARDISIASGPAYVEPTRYDRSTADEVVDKLKANDKQESADAYKSKGNGNTVLDDLGLEATASEEGDQPTQPGFETGRSAEEREKAREDAAARGEVVGGPGGRTAGAGQTFEPANNPSAPAGIPQTESQGRLPDGRGRTGTGEGYSPKPDGTPPVPGTPGAENRGADDPRRPMERAPSPQGT